MVRNVCKCGCKGWCNLYIGQRSCAGALHLSHTANDQDEGTTVESGLPRTFGASRMLRARDSCQRSHHGQRGDLGSGLRRTVWTSLVTDESATILLILPSNQDHHSIPRVRAPEDQVHTSRRIFGKQGEDVDGCFHPQGCGLKVVLHSVRSARCQSPKFTTDVSDKPPCAKYHIKVCEEPCRMLQDEFVILRPCFFSDSLVFVDAKCLDADVQVYVSRQKFMFKISEERCRDHRCKTKWRAHDKDFISLSTLHHQLMSRV